MNNRARGPRRHWEATTGQARCRNDIRNGTRIYDALLARTPALVTCEACKRFMETEDAR